jgi:diacylglycerol kinase family enzyme
VESLTVSMAGEPPAGARAVHVVFVTNTALLGGGLRLPVDARPDDGRLEIGVVPRMPRARLLWAFFCFAQGWPVPGGVLTTSRGERVRIVADRALPFSADGELMCTGTHFEIAVRHHALRVIR